MFVDTVQHPRDLLLISEQNVGGRIDREDGAGYTDRWEVHRNILQVKISYKLLLWIKEKGKAIMTHPSTKKSCMFSVELGSFS